MVVVQVELPLQMETQVQILYLTQLLLLVVGQVVVVAYQVVTVGQVGVGVVQKVAYLHRVGLVTLHLQTHLKEIMEAVQMVLLQTMAVVAVAVRLP